MKVETPLGIEYLHELYRGGCRLCPRACKAARERGERGVCGADDAVLVARAALHFWEEPPLSGERGSGTVFFSHCPLHCVYCQNADLAAGRAGVAVSIEKLADICLNLQAQQALNVNFVTPTHYAFHIAQAVEQARARGLSIPVVWNTSGYENVEVIRALEDTVDVYLADFKYADEKLAARYSHAPDYAAVALAAIEAMVETAGEVVFDEVDGMPRMKRGVIVRHMVLPGAVEESKAAIKMLHDRFGSAVRYSIMNQYTPLVENDLMKTYPELLKGVSSSEYEAVLDFADERGLGDYYWQDGPAAQESFIPAWDYTGVL